MLLTIKLVINSIFDHGRILNMNTGHDVIDFATTELYIEKLSNDTVPNHTVITTISPSLQPN